MKEKTGSLNTSETNKTSEWTDHFWDSVSSQCNRYTKVWKTSGGEPAYQAFLSVEEIMRNGFDSGFKNILSEIEKENKRSSEVFQSGLFSFTLEKSGIGSKFRAVCHVVGFLEKDESGHLTLLFYPKLNYSLDTRSVKTRTLEDNSKSSSCSVKDVLLPGMAIPNHSASALYFFLVNSERDFSSIEIPKNIPFDLMNSESVRRMSPLFLRNGIFIGQGFPKHNDLAGPSVSLIMLFPFGSLISMSPRKYFTTNGSFRQKHVYQTILEGGMAGVLSEYFGFPEEEVKGKDESVLVRKIMRRVLSQEKSKTFMEME